jgi:tetratricopeptide (TPR) repeat protein
MSEVPPARAEQYAAILKSLATLAESYFYDGKIDDAVQVLTYAQQLAEAADVLPHHRAALLLCAGFIYSWRGSLITGHYDEALITLHRAEQLAQTTHDQLLLAYALDRLGSAYYKQAVTLAETDFERPLSYFQHALRLRETAHDQRGICESLFHVGLIAERKRQYDAALRTFDAVYTTAKHHHYHDTVAEAARHRGFAHIRAGTFDQALDCFQEARLLLEATRQNIFLPFAELSVGEVFALQQHWEQAEHHYQLAYAQAQTMQIKRASVQIAYSLGEVCEAQHNAAQAYTYYETAYNLATAIHFTHGITMCGAKLQGRPTENM